MIFIIAEGIDQKYFCSLSKSIVKLNSENMQLTILSQSYQSPVIADFMQQLKEIDLLYYASDAAKKMEFEDVKEFHEAVERAMEICFQAGIEKELHFKRIYKSTYQGIVFDWKLSAFAFQLVCLNGNPGNPKVASMQIELLKNQSLNTNLKN